VPTTYLFITFVVADRYGRHFFLARLLILYSTMRDVCIHISFFSVDESDNEETKSDRGTITLMT